MLNLASIFKGPPPRTVNINVGNGERFGMVLHGDAPVQVSHIDPGSAAEKAGFRCVAQDHGCHAINLTQTNQLTAQPRPRARHSASDRVNDVILAINTREVAFFGHTDVLEVLKFFVANPSTSSPVGGMALTVLQVRPPLPCRSVDSSIAQSAMISHTPQPQIKPGYGATLVVSR